jgi:Flp pilus assembly protein TadD
MVVVKAPVPAARRRAAGEIDLRLAFVTLKFKTVLFRHRLGERRMYETLQRFIVNSTSIALLSCLVLNGCGTGHAPQGKGVEYPPNWEVEREAIPSDSHPFGGFWKKDLSNDCGWAIGPYGKGRYYVSFCGPGGCFAKGDYCPITSLTNDPGYRILNINTIEMHVAAGWWTLYRSEGREIGKPNSSVEPGQQTAEGFSHAGFAKADKGDLYGATADFAKAIELDPTYAEAYEGRGNAKGGRGDWDGAIADLNKAIELNPKYAKAYESRARFRADKGDLDGAIADLTKAIELKPKYAEAYESRGTVRVNKGDLDGAISDYSKAIDLEPQNAEAYEDRGVAKKAKGNLDGAMADYSKAIELDPEFKHAYIGRGLLKKAKGDQAGADADFAKAATIKDPCP